MTSGSPPPKWIGSGQSPVVYVELKEREIVNDSPPYQPPWRPDLKTLEWAGLVLVEDYLYDAVRSDTRSRCASEFTHFEVPDLPDEFWLTATSAAIESVLYNLQHQAQDAHDQPDHRPTDGEPFD